jgi:hypothetical protein
MMEHWLFSDGSGTFSVASMRSMRSWRSSGKHRLPVVDFIGSGVGLYHLFMIYTRQNGRGGIMACRGGVQVARPFLISSLTHFGPSSRSRWMSLIVSPVWDSLSSLAIWLLG